MKSEHHSLSSNHTIFHVLPLTVASSVYTCMAIAHHVQSADPFHGQIVQLSFFFLLLVLLSMVLHLVLLPMKSELAM